MTMPASDMIQLCHCIPLSPLCHSDLLGHHDLTVTLNWRHVISWSQCRSLPNNLTFMIKRIRVKWQNICFIRHSKNRYLVIIIVQNYWSLFRYIELYILRQKHVRKCTENYYFCRFLGCDLHTVIVDVKAWFNIQYIYLLIYTFNIAEAPLK